jgi:hypothetical protein
VTDDKGTSVSAPTPSTREGHRFIGWFFDDGIFLNDVTFPLTLNQNTTIYAEWVKDGHVHSNYFLLNRFADNTYKMYEGRNVAFRLNGYSATDMFGELRTGQLFITFRANGTWGGAWIIDDYDEYRILPFEDQTLLDTFKEAIGVVGDVLNLAETTTATLTDTTFTLNHSNIVFNITSSNGGIINQTAYCIIELEVAGGVTARAFASYHSIIALSPEERYIRLEIDVELNGIKFMIEIFMDIV